MLIMSGEYKYFYVLCAAEHHSDQNKSIKLDAVGNRYMKSIPKCLCGTSHKCQAAKYLDEHGIPPPPAAHLSPLQRQSDSLSVRGRGFLGGSEISCRIFELFPDSWHDMRMRYN